ncbi:MULTISPECIES: TIGR03985 family CRISPR-associated protein [unclassified Nostoc]|uniref:TIGR03985 family CRISPR-associated protein n=1 Tax=unclassified Nostoc TaxID=2593658 RepID=UPI00262DFFBB|nr:TIGR03985 family CRISPR-associated protein [Nostoc sp. S13]MDF5738344.1 TIGR03985 family CRISPR-associated protein [Nostoc sp. S13]
MSELVFQDIPDVELLQCLGRGYLKQNLLRAIRLWVWLRSLYGDNQYCVILDDSFSYADWRNAFFSPTHPKGEQIPPIHDFDCPCAKTAAEWLFSEKTEIVASHWRKSILVHAGINASALDKLLQQRLFGVTRRSLQADLEILAELGWLVYKYQKYYRVCELPSRPIATKDQGSAAKVGAYELSFMHEDLVEFAENHSQIINGIQRFFLKLDYVIPRSTLDAVNDWQYELRQLWAKTPVPPVKLTYGSARLGNKVICIVYPVCIYYVQRAVYLCAYGQSPQKDTNWYNFRLDHILSLVVLEWTDPQLPSNLKQHYQQKSLPNPDDIALEMSKAWGFDFYLPSQLMLLRFDREFCDRYVKDTERHDTFKEVSYHQVQLLIQREIKQPQQQETLLKILAKRSPQDAYYRVFIRYQDNQNRDNNIVMRLRAWQPKVEVLTPWDLRQSFAVDIATQFQMYHN